VRQDIETAKDKDRDRERQIKSSLSWRQTTTQRHIDRTLSAKNATIHKKNKNHKQFFDLPLGNERHVAAASLATSPVRLRVRVRIRVKPPAQP